MPPFFFEEFIVGNFDFCETCRIIIHSHVILIKPSLAAAPSPRCGGLAEMVRNHFLSLYKGSNPRWSKYLFSLNPHCCTVV